MNRLRRLVRTLILEELQAQEVEESEDEVTEVSTSAGAAGFQTPKAFERKPKKKKNCNCDT